MLKTLLRWMFIRAPTPPPIPKEQEVALELVEHLNREFGSMPAGPVTIDGFTKLPANVIDLDEARRRRA